MSAIANPRPDAGAWTPSRIAAKWPWPGLIIAESAIFTIFVVAYLFLCG